MSRDSVDPGVDRRVAENVAILQDAWHVAATPVPA
jgi:hypothetical protein